jgi:hypothetical protein
MPDYDPWVLVSPENRFRLFQYHNIPRKIILQVFLGFPAAYDLKRFSTKTSTERVRVCVSFSTSKIKNRSITPYVTIITIVGNQNMKYQVTCYRIYMIFQLFYKCCFRQFLVVTVL